MLFKKKINKKNSSEFIYVRCGPIVVKFTPQNRDIFFLYFLVISLIAA